MPDKDVKTILDLIYYQYAKLIARSAFKIPDGVGVKFKHYGFIKTTFRELKDGTKKWSDILREDWQFVDSGKKCIYCGAGDNLHKEHIVPKSIKIRPDCASCEKIQGIHNQIWACKSCNISKSNMGLYEFYKGKHPQEKKFYDFIPSLLEKKYLKTIYHCHKCTGTIDKGDLDGDDEITVLDIDFILGAVANCIQARITI